MIFLFLRWDMLIPWRVILQGVSGQTGIVSLSFNPMIPWTLLIRFQLEDPGSSGNNTGEN